MAGVTTVVLQGLLAQFHSQKVVTPERLYEDYLTGKQTLQQLSQRHHLSVSTVQRKLRTVHSVRMVSKEKDVVVLMGASYWGSSFGVLVFKNAYRGKVLWRKFLTRKETIADYLEGVEWLREHNFNIYGLVCDGLRGPFTSMIASDAKYIGATTNQFKLIGYCGLHTGRGSVEKSLVVQKIIHTFVYSKK